MGFHHYPRPASPENMKKAARRLPLRRSELIRRVTRTYLQRDSMGPSAEEIFNQWGTSDWNKRHADPALGRLSWVPHASGNHVGFEPVSRVPVAWFTSNNSPDTDGLKLLFAGAACA
jgi:hypothetical protein